MRPLYPRLEMTPLTHEVPAATACQTTLPLLQRPNCFSPLQTTAPLVEQVVDAPPPDEGEDGCAGVPVPGEDGVVGLAGEGAVGFAVTVTSVVEVWVGKGAALGTTGAALGTTGAALEAPGAKTPPGFEGAEGAAVAEGFPPAAEVGAAEGSDGSDGVVPEVVPQLPPVGDLRSFVAPFWTTSPGLGNWTAKLATDSQVSSRLATSMSGSASNAVLSLAPPVTSMGAQFMYISGTPLSLENQVQAKVAFPFGILAGSSKSYDCACESTPGHPPSIDLMTLNTEFAVGSVSNVTLSWQDPPPWTALPESSIVCFSPTAIAFMVETVNPF